MPRLMEKKDWIQTVANVDAAESVWCENISSDGDAVKNKRRRGRWDSTMKKLWMMVTAFTVATSLLADTETVGGYTWTYRIVNGEAEICATYDEIIEGADGSRLPMLCTPAVSPWPDGHVDIPSMLGGKPVTSIGDFAFYNMTGTSVTIPNGVKSIGYGAFMSCIGLLTVSMC